MRIKTILAGIGICAATAFSAQAQNATPLKIGFLAEMAGMYGAPGQDQYDAFMLAVEERGGKLGGVPVEIFREDTQFKPDVASQVVDRLMDREKVQLFTGVTYTHIALAIYKKINDKGGFLIASNTGPAPMAGEGCVPNFFTTTWQNDQLSEVVGLYAAEQGYENVFALAPNYQAGRDFIDGFKAAYGKPLLNEVYTPVAQQDFSAELSMIQAANPDAVYVFYPGALGVNFVKQYDQAGLSSVPLLNTATTEGINLPAQGKAATGAINGSFWGPDFDNETSKHFVQAFEAKYERIPSQYAAQAYDSALLIDSALKKVGGDLSDKDAFRAALREADFDSLRGHFEFGNNHFPIQDFHVFEAYEDEKGRMSVRRVATPMVKAQDKYASQCSMSW